MDRPTRPANRSGAAADRRAGRSRWRELRPFESEAALFEAAESHLVGACAADWLEAFAAHPKIGDRDALRARFAATAAWAASEQSGVAGASDDVLQELAECNLRYEARFGYIFIVCATGKTAGEMLAVAQASG